MWVRERDEWVWGQYDQKIEVWGVWGREGACEATCQRG